MLLASRRLCPGASFLGSKAWRPKWWCGWRWPAWALRATSPIRCASLLAWRSWGRRMLTRSPAKPSPLRSSELDWPALSVVSFIRTIFWVPDVWFLRTDWSLMCCGSVDLYIGNLENLFWLAASKKTTRACYLRSRPRVWCLGNVNICMCSGSALLCF